MTFQHQDDCRGGATCRHGGPARCSIGGKLHHTVAYTYLTQAERRRYQAAVDQAQDDATAAEVIGVALLSGNLRRIEQEARAERIHRLKTDPKGYRREMRQMAEVVRVAGRAHFAANLTPDCRS